MTLIIAHFALSMIANYLVYYIGWIPPMYSLLHSFNFKPLFLIYQFLLLQVYYNWFPIIMIIIAKDVFYLYKYFLDQDFNCQIYWYGNQNYDHFPYAVCLLVNILVNFLLLTLSTLINNFKPSIKLLSQVVWWFIRKYLDDRLFHCLTLTMTIQISFAFRFRGQISSIILKKCCFASDN